MKHVIPDIHAPYHAYLCSLGLTNAHVMTEVRADGQTIIGLTAQLTTFMRIDVRADA